MRIRRLIGGILSGCAGLVVLAFLLLARGGGHAVVTVSPLEPGEAARQIAALRARLDRPLPAVSVEISSADVTAELQSAASPQATDRWTVSHVRALRGLIDWIHVGGPEPVPAGASGLSVAQRGFDLGAVDFAAVPQIARAAIERVALSETPSAVRAMELSKGLILIPFEHAGSLRWRVTVSAAHESAVAYADPAGRLTGVELDGTLRAQRLDLHQGGQPLLDLAAQITARFNGQEQIERLLVYGKNLSFDLVGGGDEGPGTYVSSLDGVRRNRLNDTLPAMALPPGLPRNQPFAAREVEWGALPRLVQAARDALKMPDAQVSLIEITKPPHGLAEPAIQWEITLQPPDGREAAVALDPSGRVLRFYGAAAQVKPPDLLTAGAVRQMLGALRRDAGERAGILEITLRADRAQVEMPDPRKPGAVVLLGYEGYGFESLPAMPLPPGRGRDRPYDTDALFDLDALDPAFLQSLPDLKRTALRRLKIPGGRIEQIILGKARLMFEGNSQVLAEIDVTGNDGADGRVFLDSTGRILRADGP